MAIDPKAIEIHQNIVAALKDAGAAVEVNEEGRVKKVNGQGLEWGGITVSERYSGSTWYRKPTGIFDVVVGEYGDRKRFPARKAGFDYAKIAQAVLNFVDTKKAERKATMERSKNREAMYEVIAQLNEGLEGHHLANTRIGVCDIEPGKVEMTMRLTPEQAQRLVSFIVSAL